MAEIFFVSVLFRATLNHFFIFLNVFSSNIYIYLYVYIYLRFPLVTPDRVSLASLARQTCISDFQYLDLSFASSPIICIINLHWLDLIVSHSPITVWISISEIRRGCHEY